MDKDKISNYMIYTAFIFGLIVSIYHLRKPNLAFMLLLGSKTLCFALTIKKITELIGQKFEPLQLASMSAITQFFLFMNKIDILV